MLREREQHQVNYELHSANDACLMIHTRDEAVVMVNLAPRSDNKQQQHNNYDDDDDDTCTYNRSTTYLTHQAVSMHRDRTKI